MAWGIEAILLFGSVAILGLAALAAAVWLIRTALRTKE